MRAHRLCSNTEYRHTLRQGKKTHTPMFVFYSKNNHHDTARLGISAPARTTKRANQRNKIKRAIRETFRKKRWQLPKRDYIVIYKGVSSKPCAETPQTQLNTFWDGEINATPFKSCRG